MSYVVNDGKVRRTFAERMIGAALLHPDVYEELEADTRSNLEAAGVVSLVAIASTIGSGRFEVYSMAVGIFSWLLGVLIWAGVTYLIGDKILGGTATWGELLRTLAFAQVPGLLLPLLIVPQLVMLIAPVVIVWTAFTTVIALRQALDFSTGKAILTAVAGGSALLAFFVLI